MLTAIQSSGKVLTYIHQIEYIFSTITPFTRNTETERYIIDGAGGAFHRTTDLMGTRGVDIGTVQRLNETADPAAANT